MGNQKFFLRIQGTKGERYLVKGMEIKPLDLLKP